jgi:hypothetical protein
MSKNKLSSTPGQHAEKTSTMESANRRSLRITFLIFSFALSMLSYTFYPSFMSYAFIIVALIVFFTSVFSPYVLGLPFKVWIKIGRTIAKFNTMVLLGLIFFLVFLPFGLILRLANGDFMKRKFTDAESYWEDYKMSGLYDRGRYERQF